MPIMQTAIVQINQVLSPSGVLQVDYQAIDPEARFVDVLQDVFDVTDIPGFEDFMATMPAGVSEALLSLMRSAARRSMPLTLMWKPGYEWELSVSDVADTETTAGGISVLVQSPYPAKSKRAIVTARRQAASA